MKVYTTCFIGIPLPKKYQQAFETLLVDVSKMCPMLELIDPKTPHITGYYLDVQSQFNLTDIAKSVESIIGLLKDTKLTVGGFGYFGEDNPRVLFLNVLYPEVLKDFNQSITKLLKKYYANDNDLPFHPHMTIARINTSESKKLLEESNSDFKARLNEIIWTFPITEVVLYGVDSTKDSEHSEHYEHYEHYEKLITILVR